MSKKGDWDPKQLRAIGHKLKPVVTISGNGLSEGVMAEVDRALAQHELIKVKLAVGSRDARAEVTDELCGKAGAATNGGQRYLDSLFYQQGHDRSVGCRLFGLF